MQDEGGAGPPCPHRMVNEPETLATAVFMARRRSFCHARGKLPLHAAQLEGGRRPGEVAARTVSGRCVILCDRIFVGGCHWRPASRQCSGCAKFAEQGRQTFSICNSSKSRRNRPRSLLSCQSCSSCLKSEISVDGENRATPARAACHRLLEQMSCEPSAKICVICGFSARLEQRSIGIRSGESQPSADYRQT